MTRERVDVHFDRNPWPSSVAGFMRKYHLHLKRRGFTEEEIRFFKSKDRWKKGAYVEESTLTSGE